MMYRPTFSNYNPYKCKCALLMSSATIFLSMNISALLLQFIAPNMVCLYFEYLLLCVIKFNYHICDCPVSRTATQQFATTHLTVISLGSAVFLFFT